MERAGTHRLRRGRVSEPGRLYLLTSVTHKRLPFFEDFYSARCVITQLRQAEHEGAVNSLAWVVMPDHIHWLIELKLTSLQTLMRRFKSRSSCAIYRTGKLKGRLWQAGFHDRALRKEEDVPAVARYIVCNPLRAGLARRLGDYPHWDAVWL